jgi:glucose-6-phosphate isomerase
MISSIQNIVSRYNLNTATIEGRPRLERHLSDLKGCYADSAGYEEALKASNPLIYAVASIEPAGGEGDLHYGLGMIMPGKIGSEYYLTKGHLHAWRPAAEFYFGLQGEGAMLLEDEKSGESRMVPLVANSVVYVPGHTAHRTVNTGTTPLLYLGVYPARAGHDYGSIAQKNFRNIIVELNGLPVMLPRPPSN